MTLPLPAELPRLSCHGLGDRQGHRPSAGMLRRWVTYFWGQDGVLWIPGPLEASRHPEMQKQLSLRVGGRGLWQGLGLGLSREWVAVCTPATGAPPDRCQAVTVQLEEQRKARASVLCHPQALSSPQGLGRGWGRDVGRQGRPPRLSKGIGCGRTCPEGPDSEISLIPDKPGTHFTPAPPTPPDGEWRHRVAGRARESVPGGVSGHSWGVHTTCCVCLEQGG